MVTKAELEAAVLVEQRRKAHPGETAYDAILAVLEELEGFPRNKNDERVLRLHEVLASRSLARLGSSIHEDTVEDTGYPQWSSGLRKSHIPPAPDRQMPRGDD